MAEFLTTSGISYEIERVLKTARRSLTLVSPYLKISTILLERLRDADRRDVEITIVFGKSELDWEQEEKLALLSNLRLYYLDNLHAKCYLNESRAVVGSMNMYEFSEKNNRETGVLLTCKDDESAFRDLVEEAESIINNADPRGEQKAGCPHADRGSEFLENASSNNNGYCIRCRDDIWFDPLRPLCAECYWVWAQWGDEDYREQYCIECGGSEPTSKGRPFCNKCAPNPFK